MIHISINSSDIPVNIRFSLSHRLHAMHQQPVGFVLVSNISEYSKGWNLTGSFSHGIKTFRFCVVRNGFVCFKLACS